MKVATLIVSFAGLTSAYPTPASYNQNTGFAGDSADTPFDLYDCETAGFKQFTKWAKVAGAGMLIAGLSVPLMSELGVFKPEKIALNTPSPRIKIIAVNESKAGELYPDNLARAVQSAASLDSDFLEYGKLVVQEPGSKRIRLRDDMMTTRRGIEANNARFGRTKRAEPACGAPRNLRFRMKSISPSRANWAVVKNRATQVKSRNLFKPIMSDETKVQDWYSGRSQRRYRPRFRQHNLGSISSKHGMRAPKMIFFAGLVPYLQDLHEALRKWDNAIGRSYRWFDDAVGVLQYKIGGAQEPSIYGNTLKLKLICFLGGVRSCRILKQRKLREEAEKKWEEGITRLVNECEAAGEKNKGEGSDREILKEKRLLVRCLDVLDMILEMNDETPVDSTQPQTPDRDDRSELFTTTDGATGDHGHLRWNSTGIRTGFIVARGG
ncbi:hypothetical protein XA68_12061 [Ophiocordyceps unilateralis]|uniref:Uncharacterized protein n=1 Tax=Ophiocordyceps unilateralis TaxID=268505 RepID=A0A2A9PFQ1_OPHUN|nr:hypothetical protein XA68_12061 [Ophiocordyceps unilateralis]